MWHKGLIHLRVRVNIPRTYVVDDMRTLSQAYAVRLCTRHRHGQLLGCFMLGASNTTSVLLHTGSVARCARVRVDARCVPVDDASLVAARRTQAGPGRTCSNLDEA